MMLLLPVLLAAAPLLLSPALAPSIRAGQDCEANRILQAGDNAKPIIYPLGAEPPAQALSAVAREIDGCNRPIVLTPQVGQPPVR